MKRAKKQAVTIELTPRQVEGLAALGRIFWPGQELELELSEVCRRVLLDGADSNIGVEWRKEGSPPERLLELECVPVPWSTVEEPASCRRAYPAR